MKNLRKSAGLAFAILAAATIGCRQVENPGKVFPQSPTVDQTRSKEILRNQPEDLPVPRDLQYITRANQSFYHPQARVGRFHYWGNAPVEEVVAFYRERMPQRPYGWTLVNEQSQGQTTTMHYRKDSDECEVSVGPEGSATIAVVSLNAKSRNP